jgi:NADPH2 dehydrogenase
MKKSSLFSPIQLRSVIVPNRITISPMCQYSAAEGNANEWHTSHYMQMATSGAGMFVIESTAVNETGRISYGDLGLYSDDNEESLAKMIRKCKKYSSTPIACQLSHSGRKGSVSLPWLGGKHLLKSEDSWNTVSASSIPRYDGGTIPSELSLSQLKNIRQDFIKSTQRAINAKVDIIELHAAHGYLLHQFLSPISNHRTDEYGGSFKNRIRFILEVATDVRRTWPEEKPIGIRLTAKDWMDNGTDIDDCVNLALELKNIGIDYICISSGGIVPITNLVFRDGFQVGFAREIKKRTGMITRVVGGINNYRMAQKIINSDDADMVAIGRSYLNDPHWVWRAASGLKEDIFVPNQYKRGYW